MTKYSFGIYAFVVLAAVTVLSVFAVKTPKPLVYKGTKIATSENFKAEAKSETLRPAAKVSAPDYSEVIAQNARRFSQASVLTIQETRDESPKEKIREDNIICKKGQQAIIKDGKVAGCKFEKTGI